MMFSRGAVMQVHVPLEFNRDYPIPEWFQPFAEHTDTIPNICLI